MFQPDWGRLSNILAAAPDAERLVGFVPTGWSHTFKNRSEMHSDSVHGKLSIFTVAYSEHSATPIFESL